MRVTRKDFIALCIVLVLMVLVETGTVFYLRLDSFASATPSPVKATATPAVTRRNAVTGFQGIYVLSGGNSATYADDPIVAGTYLGYYWSQLEQQDGQYNWSQIDRDMQPWVAHGKKVIVRISTAGWKQWQPPYSGQGTPQWVFKKGVSSVTENDGAIKPQYWNPTFLQYLSTFVRAFANRYDGNAHIMAVEIGVGDGGETSPDTHFNSNPGILQKWKSIGYTNAVWWSTIQRIITIYTSSFHSTRLAIMPNSSFIASNTGYKDDLVLDYAVSHNLWLQDNGLVANRTLPTVWKKVPVIEEQRNATDQSRDTMQQDVQTALQNNAVVLMVFASDIAKSANHAALVQAAALVGH
jgi:Beta-galactosidase